MNIIDSDLLSVQEARILLEHAREARVELMHTGQRRLDFVYQELLESLKPHARELAQKAYEETDYGSADDEYRLLVHLLQELPRRLDRMVCVGVIEQDLSEACSKVGIPKGICLSLPSAWLSSLVIIHNVVLAIKTANPVIVVPHRRAVKTTCYLMGLIKEKLDELYYPQGAVSVLSTYSVEGESELIRDRDVALVIETCRDKTCDWIETRSKMRFKGTIGNNPVFVEKTARLDFAAEQIVAAKSYMNGLLPGVEQSVVVEAAVADQFKRELRERGAYFLSDEEADRLKGVLYDSNGKAHREVMGKSAHDLASRAAIAIPAQTRILVVDQPFVSQYSPYSREKFAPVLSFYTESDWQHACEKCIELILNERHGHSMSIYSEDEEVIRQFILKKPVARVLCNHSSAFGAIGISSRLFLSYTLAVAGVGGEAFANLQPKHFLLCRKAVHQTLDFEKALKISEQEFEASSAEISQAKRETTSYHVCMDAEKIHAWIDEQLKARSSSSYTQENNWFKSFMDECKQEK